MIGQVALAQRPVFRAGQSLVRPTTMSGALSRSSSGGEPLVRPTFLRVVRIVPDCATEEAQMSFGSPNNPYGQPQEPQQPGYGHPQQGQPGYGHPQQGQPGYGHPQQGQPGYGHPQQGQPGYGYPQAPGVPPQQGYGYPQHPGYPGGSVPGGPRVASMGRRFGARMIDGVAFGIIYTVLIVVGAVGSLGAAQDCDPNSVTYDSCINDAGSDFASAFGAMFGVLAIVGLLYEWLMTGLVGATLGKLCVGIRVVKVNTGQKPGLGSSFIRWIIPMVGSIACGIGQLLVYLSPFWDKSGRQQGWHDKAASTMVVQN
jgi:uncharacterized RDD family membrane protein YckC